MMYFLLDTGDVEVADDDADLVMNIMLKRLYIPLVPPHLHIPQSLLLNLDPVRQ